MCCYRRIEKKEGKNICHYGPSRGIVSYVPKIIKGEKLLSELDLFDEPYPRKEDTDYITQKGLSYFIYDGCIFICKSIHFKKLKSLIKKHWIENKSKKDHLILGAIFGYTVNSTKWFLDKRKIKATKKEIIDFYDKFRAKF